VSRNSSEAIAWFELALPPVAAAFRKANVQRQISTGCVVLLVMLATAMLPQPARGFALIGPTNFGSAYFVNYNKGFSWANDPITVRLDASFTTTFGAGGTTAFINALATWGTEFTTQATGAQNPTGGANDFFSPADPGNGYDLESISLHELGHVLGLHHPDQAGTQNFNTTGGVRVATGNELMNSVPVLSGESQRKLTQDDLDGFNHLYSFDPNFTFLGAPATQIGNNVGAKIDVFAFNFADVPLLAPFAGVLALADVGIDKANPFNGPGSILGADIFFNVPEPTSLSLLALGLAAGFLRRPVNQRR
jgi:hypothetical protein